MRKYYYSSVLHGSFSENIGVWPRKAEISERKQQEGCSLAGKFDKFDISF